ncbi:MAG: 2OG-Fe(II) oxygenase [Gammaproteobacteria bacterium]|nr:2OG-Fe(II) oxygenase [Gammaproteobacteria bacterium]
MNIYQKITSKNAPDINSNIETGFLQHHNDPDIRKTHLFEGRYENIYINDQHIAALKSLVNEAVKLAENFLDIKNLRAGYWFNYMPPEATTTLHTHDDDDELLSCVYYVNVPENSGNLIIYDDSDDNKQKIEIKSRTGDFIFFKPDVRHEVSKNNSSEFRLSIGFNFGLNQHPE